VTQAVEMPVGATTEPRLLAVHPSVGIHAHAEPWLAAMALSTTLGSIPEARGLQRLTRMHLNCLTHYVHSSIAPSGWFIWKAMCLLPEAFKVGMYLLVLSLVDEVEWWMLKACK
jgi:hypothetical protein